MAVFELTQRRVRQAESALVAIKWLMMAVAAWIVVRTLTFSVVLPMPRAAGASAPDGRVAGTSAGAVHDFRSVWERDLRQDLLPPKPKELPKAVAAPPPIPVKLPKLAATFVEAGRAWGLFVGLQGVPRVRTSGDAIDGFDIVAIVPGSCTLRQGDKTFELAVPSEQTKAGRGSRASLER